MPPPAKANSSHAAPGADGPEYLLIRGHVGYGVHHTDAVAEFIFILENELDKVVIRAMADPTPEVEVSLKPLFHLGYP